MVGDLFPGLQVPEPDYDLLTGALKAVCKRMNVQPKEDILNSAIQLFETVQVRHGLMLVGETSCGKTTVLRMLQAAMSDLKGQRDFVNVNVHSINPKSITAGQLFGVFDENTHEWTDGASCASLQFQKVARALLHLSPHLRCLCLQACSRSSSARAPATRARIAIGSCLTAPSTPCGSRT